MKRKKCEIKDERKIIVLVFEYYFQSFFFSSSGFSGAAAVSAADASASTMSASTPFSTGAVGSGDSLAALRFSSI
jgi:hypothetical protein